jgi:hypothetical protein
MHGTGKNVPQAGTFLRHAGSATETFLKPKDCEVS